MVKIMKFKCFIFYSFIPLKKYYLLVWKIAKERLICDSKSVSNYRRIIIIK